MSLSDVSDLTDLSSEEDEPLQKRNTKAKKGPKEYKISHVLRAPRTTQYTAKSLYDQIIDDAINLDPEYQRAVVWQEEKQSGLIDSVLRNYYIPPIIFAVTVQDDGSELRTCIDGKQRLTSIQRFIDGQIPHKDSFTNEKLWYKPSAANARRKLLPQHLRTQFAHKQIVCVEYTALNDDQEREIFQRVQLGVALSPAERLQALVGPWSTVIREIQSQVLGEEGFEGYLDWGHARGRDFQCLATIGYLIENHPKTTIPGTKTLEKWLQKTQPVSTQLRADLHETFRIFITLAREKKYSVSLNRPTRVSPIEFVVIGVLIYLKRQVLSLTQLSSAIEKMRKDVRASYHDIRSNTRVTKHLMDFVAKKIKVSELRSDGEGDKPAVSAITKASNSMKRKRVIESDDESDDEPPPKTKPAKSSNATQAQGSKTTRQASGSNTPPTNGTTKKASQTLPAKPQAKAKASAPSRATNNSMSSLAAPARKSPLLTPAKPLPRRQSPVQPPPGPNTQIGPSSSVVSNPGLPAQPSPLTVQTGPRIKVESPQMAHLNVTYASSASAMDRLAPIRAAKAGFVPGSSQSPAVNSGTEAITMAVPSLGPSVDLPQNPAVIQGVMAQPPFMSQQSPPAPPAMAAQPLPLNPGQFPPIDPMQVEGLLHAIRTQFPHLAVPAPSPTVVQSPTLDAASIASLGQHLQLMGLAANQAAPSALPTRPANGVPNHLPYNGVPTGPSYLGGSTSAHGYFSQSNQASTHALPRKPSNGSVVPSDLPQRPNTSMRAEPLGPPPRSASSSTSSFSEDRRGSYGGDRHHPSDNRRSMRHDQSRDWERRESGYSGRRESWGHERPRDDGWGARGRGGGYRA